MQINKSLFIRLKIVEGQIRGSQEMLSKNVYCIDIITQTSVVKRSLFSPEYILRRQVLL
ncbi:MAG: metal-sensing transcriptional repressor [Minisyncoccota bacterium]